MRCRQCERLIQKKLDGDISEKERAQLEEHVAACAACRAALADYDWIAGTLAAEAPPQEESISVAVMERIRTRPPRFRPAPMIAAAAVAAAILLAAAVLMMKAIDRPESSANGDRVTVERADDVSDTTPRELPRLLDVTRHVADLDVVGKSQTAFADGVETLKDDVQTTRNALAETFEDFTRDVPLL